MKDEIPGPHVVAMRSLGGQTGGDAVSRYLFWLLPYFKPFATANMLHLLTPYLPTFSGQQGADAAVTVARMMPR